MTTPTPRWTAETEEGPLGEPRSVTMRDPIYTERCVIQALIDEVRRLRTEVYHG